MLFIGTLVILSLFMAEGVRGDEHTHTYKVSKYLSLSFMNYGASVLNVHYQWKTTFFAQISNLLYFWLSYVKLLLLFGGYSPEHPCFIVYTFEVTHFFIKNTGTVGFSGEKNPFILSRIRLIFGHLIKRLRLE